MTIFPQPVFAALIAKDFPTLADAASVYLLPLFTAAAAILLLLLHMQRQTSASLTSQLDETKKRLEQQARERNIAQEELFRRLYEEQELNKEKIQFQAQLTDYEKYAALAQLALGAAHEINNPLLGILSHLELELKTAHGEQRAEIEQCIDGAKRISATLKGLLNYARPGPLVLSRVSLQRLVADTLAFLENQPMMRGKHLHNNVPADLPLIRADSNQLSQVLMNLLLNAGQATPEAGTITVSASRLTYVDSVEIQVADTGNGIPPDILPHIFEPFFTTKRGKGTGLGLSISQAYVHSHGGSIRVDSVVAHGTTVTITLPVRQEEELEKEHKDEVVV